MSNKTQTTTVPVEAICHDHQNLLNGLIRGLTANGCEFLGPKEGDTPTFPKKTQVTLNLLDESTGASQNCIVRLSGVSRREGRWSYRIQWEEAPELLKRYLKAA